MSIATFESPQVVSQRFFPWVFDEDTDCGYSAAEPIEDFDSGVEAGCQLPNESADLRSEFDCESRSNERKLEKVLTQTEARIGAPVRLGAIMIKLLKSYGITDAEIAEGMATYAAQTGFAKAG